MHCTIREYLRTLTTKPRWLRAALRKQAAGERPPWMAPPLCSWARPKLASCALLNTATSLGLPSLSISHPLSMACCNNAHERSVAGSNVRCLAHSILHKGTPKVSSEKHCGCSTHSMYVQPNAQTLSVARSIVGCSAHAMLHMYIDTVSGMLELCTYIVSSRKRCRVR